MPHFGQGMQKAMQFFLSPWPTFPPNYWKYEHQNEHMAKWLIDTHQFKVPPLQLVGENDIKTLLSMGYLCTIVTGATMSMCPLVLAATNCGFIGNLVRKMQHAEGNYTSSIFKKCQKWQCQECWLRQCLPMFLLRQWCTVLRHTESAAFLSNQTPHAFLWCLAGVKTCCLFHGPGQDSRHLTLLSALVIWIGWKDLLGRKIPIWPFLGS